MDVVFAAIGGPEVDSAGLSSGIEALARRAEFEEIPVTLEQPPSAFCLRQPWTGERSAWCDVELQGGDALSMLVDVARAVSTHIGKPVRAVASGVERQIGAARVAIGYRAYEVLPDGTSRTLEVAEADQGCREVADDHPRDELGGLLAVLVDDEPKPGGGALEGARDGGRYFRRRALLDSPRLSRLAATILAAKAISVTSDPSGRVRLRIDATDGGTQISLVSDEEAATLRRATNRI